VRGALASHLGSRQVARVLYGSIIGLALVLALQHHGSPDGEVVGALVGTAIAVGLAELYSEVIGTATRTHRRVGRDQIGEISSEVAATAAGVAFPSVYFVAAALGAMETETAFTVAKWSGLGLITAYGFAAARLTGSPLGESLLRAAGAAVIAGFLIVVKALLH
jgi:hypothetical protein